MSMASPCFPTSIRSGRLNCTGLRILHLNYRSTLRVTSAEQYILDVVSELAASANIFTAFLILLPHLLQDSREDETPWTVQI
ncbi:hypothetical protein D1872_307800 [compost metagenome]